MGLLDDTPERWDNFRAKIKTLNEQLKKENAQAKVFFFSRHGQGWRKSSEVAVLLWTDETNQDNVGEAKYGTTYWDS
jgi:hypothetical protein